MQPCLSHLPCVRSRERGFILVAVLWILTALATLATIFSMYVINTATAFAVHDERLQAEGLARAAIELSVYQVAASTPAPLSRGSFAFRIGNATVNAEFMAETARIDLNAAPRDLLAGLFVTLGATRAQGEYYADRIIGWRSPPTPENPEAESGLYRAAGLPYGPRAAPFPHTGELGLVLGLPDFIVERTLPFVTVYSGQPQINIYNAAPQVVAALPGMDPQRLNAVLVQREAGPQNAQGLLAMLGAVQTLANTQSSKALRVTAGIAFDSGQRMTTEAVIFILDSGTEPYRVLTWRDDMDDTSARVVAR
ncbi:MAG: general secretion pathway protein GspK [Alphaproteobacteria bacterium]|nr:MAG: general secretion pathway protein GspK [Alphaproteobacteria bacterium]